MDANNKVSEGAAAQCQCPRPTLLQYRASQDERKAGEIRRSESHGRKCWISRRYKRALTGTANGGRHKATPCLAEEVLKAPVGQPAFQQLKGATALYCLPAPRLLCRRLAVRYSGGAPPGMLPSPPYRGTGTTDPG